MDDVKYPYPGAFNAEAYEWLNRCTDPERKVETLIAAIAPWAEKAVLDIGAGSGFHAVWFAQEAQQVIAVEPDPRLRQQMFARLAQMDNIKISVLADSAENILLSDEVVDMAYARFAYFFGTPDCLPGLAQVMRILKPGGNFFVIDVIPDWGEWGQITTKAYPDIFHPRYHEDQMQFYQAHGFSVHQIETVFCAPNKMVLETVFKMDFPHAWEELLSEITCLELRYKLAVFHYHKQEHSLNNGQLAS